MESEFSQIKSTNPFYDKGWFTGVEKDADYELSENQSLIKLRKTAQKLDKNNYNAVGLREAMINFINGTGVILRYPKNREYEKQIQKVARQVDKERMLSLADIADICVESTMVNGDVLVNMIYTPYVGSNYKTSVELVEASRIKTPPNERRNPLVVEGVKKDEQGVILGYYVRKLTTTPDVANTALNEGDKDFYYLPAVKNGRKVCWLYSTGSRRPHQTRSIPLITPTMNLLRFKNDYLETTLIQARVTASFTAFIHSKNPKAMNKALQEQFKSPLEKVGHLQAGMIFNLHNSDRVDFASPTRPSDNTDQFIQRVNREFCMPYRMAYEVLFMDLSTVNYASYKAGMQETRRSTGRKQRGLSATLKMIMHFMTDEMVALGMLGQDFDFDELLISFPKIETVDDEKTARADNIKILKTETISRHDSCESNNLDYNLVKADLDAEAIDNVDRQAEVLKYRQKLEKKFGIIFPETVQPVDDRETKKRKGENKDGEIDSVDKTERRKEDGNWK